jgi:hypothetical protein
MPTNRKGRKDSRMGNSSNKPGLPPLPDGLRCSVELRAGVESITGAARLSIAAVTDMLTGSITPREASVANQTSSLVLKGCALNLRYAKAATFKLPEVG